MCVGLVAGATRSSSIQSRGSAIDEVSGCGPRHAGHHPRSSRCKGIAAVHRPSVRRARRRGGDLRAFRSMPSFTLPFTHTPLDGSDGRGRSFHQSIQECAAPGVAMSA